MRTAAIIINLALLGLVLNLVFRGDFMLNSDEAPLFLAMLLAPSFSTVALLLRGAPNKDWLARFCERNALEERRKLDQIRSRTAPADPPTKR
ncbi:MAG: hypothetical protein AB9869_15585 [Verrucomicrobiia bacterium]